MFLLILSYIKEKGKEIEQRKIKKFSESGGY